MALEGISDRAKKMALASVLAAILALSTQSGQMNTPAVVILAVGMVLMGMKNMRGGALSAAGGDAGTEGNPNPPKPSQVALLMRKRRSITPKDFNGQKVERGKIQIMLEVRESCVPSMSPTLLAAVAAGCVLDALHVHGLW